MLQFGFFWAVGVTRFTDNKHNISDIVSGLVPGHLRGHYLCHESSGHPQIRGVGCRVISRLAWLYPVRIL